MARNSMKFNWSLCTVNDALNQVHEKHKPYGKPGITPYELTYALKSCWVILGKIGQLSLTFYCEVAHVKQS